MEGHPMRFKRIEDIAAALGSIPEWDQRDANYLYLAAELLRKTTQTHGCNDAGHPLDRECPACLLMVFMNECD